jgi:putative holliday junction resolvase
MKMIRKRILAIDPGDKRIGIAISDESNSLARPLMVLIHVSRFENAKSILAIAEENQISKIIVGQALDNDGVPTYSGRKANRLAAEITSHGNIPVLLWDESFSTNDAQSLSMKMGVKQKKRKGHQDDLAAAIILQTYLDSL